MVDYKIRIEVEYEDFEKNKKLFNNKNKKKFYPASG